MSMIEKQPKNTGPTYQIIEIYNKNRRKTSIITFVNLKERFLHFLRQE